MNPSNKILLGVILVLAIGFVPNAQGITPQLLPKAPNLSIKQLPDLTPAAEYVSGGPGPNGACQSPMRVRIGAKNLQPYPVTVVFMVRFYHLGVPVGEWQVQGLEGNTQKTFDYSYTTTCQAPSSSPNFKIIVDPTNAVTELNKNNNTMDIKMTPP